MARENLLLTCTRSVLQDKYINFFYEPCVLKGHVCFFESSTQKTYKAELCSFGFHFTKTDKNAKCSFSVIFIWFSLISTP